MKLSQFKQYLKQVVTVDLYQPEGSMIAPHFHITEAGLNTRYYIDCGGTLRTEKAMSFQVWLAQDTEHRLTPAKLLRIIEIAEGHFGNEDLNVEIEFQNKTIGRYDLNFGNDAFNLVPKHTACQATDSCGSPQKAKLELAQLKSAESCCIPEGGCC